MAVVVAYHPDFAVLDELLQSLSRQVIHTYLIDNSAHDDFRVQEWFGSTTRKDVSLIRLGSNRGVATALNAGIRIARAAGATHVLLSDQDSLPPPDMVSGLLTAARSLGDEARVAAVGPVFINRRTGMTHPFQHPVPGWMAYKHALPTPESPVVETLTLITSGSLVSIAALNDIGEMRDDLFIDYVDTEWCHRARHRGWRIYGTCLAKMTHDMGDAALRVWLFGWRNEMDYSPERVYYRVRNFVALYRMPHIEFRFKIRHARFFLGDIYSQVFFGTQRRKALRMTLKGLRDGINGHLGPYPSR
ncbi:glycosyltransferase family 2 protein [Fulvimonas sp. R45]|uniref:glycosyltransferase family 2 protein n=1 Tax=Fulvimonas sp. R45 TaxID=3045937 RepID=UPI00265F9748|nr:glycosyltransferase family 2 protein [Fulvimonas sp. R45]MDO1527786.1 glycosyltransferase family 2 protein [Fulvimonas sp. R45]